MAAALLSLAELWFSQGRLKTVRTRCEISQRVDGAIDLDRSMPVAEAVLEPIAERPAEALGAPDPRQKREREAHTRHDDRLTDNDPGFAVDAFGS